MSRPLLPAHQLILPLYPRKNCRGGHSETTGGYHRGGEERTSIYFWFSRDHLFPPSFHQPQDVTLDGSSLVAHPCDSSGERPVPLMPSFVEELGGFGR